MPLPERLRRLRVDTSPLRESHDFRILFWAGTTFYFGQMVTYVALPFHVYDLTGSNFAVGALGLVELVPLVVFGLYGGVLADRGDRRLILVATGAAQVVLTALLAAHAFLPEPQVWLIYVTAALLSVAQSMQRPAREALLPRTIRRDQQTAAIALSGLGREVSMLAGPMLGGLLLHATGAGWCFVIDVVGIAIATVLFTRLGHYPPGAAGTEPQAGLHDVLDGLRYAWARKDLLASYVVDIVAMVLAMPVVLFPALAEDVFAHPELLGLLYAAESVGSFVVTATSGWAAHVHRHGRGIVLAALAWGLAIAAAGLAPNVWWALVALTFAGAFDMISGMFRMTLWNQTIPDALRGRLAGIELLSYSVGPMAGQARAGLVADGFGVRRAIWTGGLLCAGGVAAVTVWWRDLWTYDERTAIPRRLSGR